MLKKVLLVVMVLASKSFGMSLEKLNRASKTELMQINGVGEKKAEAIIRERQNGKFKSFEDFQRVKGVGRQIASNVKNDVKKKRVRKVAKKKKRI
ncbi:ComEA family DNA-binding protein [Sulfurovum sp. ST-21]|uniref:Helix-hairpin-helix domain-containing protein n=1 Tax=Sulfurovum indicum TaxID=2779528 RepID=A0A7M1S2Z4_9BACT|nr:helix-hairpin-helix domain-containing protein [Sulfurovum indicum]QOR61797.1 helix-hairpin-helix domain-containing protein [Sulfurovum indicum]